MTGCTGTTTSVFTAQTATNRLSHTGLKMLWHPLKKLPKKVLTFQMMFHGKNPGYGLSRLFSKTKCPQCKSKRIVPHPGIQYKKSG